jgi:hypothetical protein
MDRRVSSTVSAVKSFSNEIAQSYTTDDRPQDCRSSRAALNVVR